MSFQQLLGYSTDNDGFVFCNDESQAKNNVERLYLRDCKKLPISPSAIFFRRFYKDDTSQVPFHSEPNVCIFKVESSFFNSDAHIKLHAALWSAGRNEIYIIQAETRIDIINARQPAKVINKDELTLEDKNLCLINSTLEKFNDLRFSTHLFQSGVFWEQDDFKDKIDEGNSPHLFLLNHLMAAREAIHKENILPKVTTDKLLVISILVKFLEEIKDDDGKHTLKEIYQQNEIESEKFAEVIRKNKLFDILDKLKGEFNGEIFNRFSDDERETIQKADLKALIQFLEADIDIPSQQLFIWKQYDFKFLPAEVISAIYENFTGEGEKGVVYTPIHLVNMLVDEVMPLDNADVFKNEDFKILDPACGSGVFLVAAYKRLLQWWIINNNKAIDAKTAKEILENNIYGVDIEETSVLVSVFGLTTALLDQLSPKEIWNNLKFKDLRKENIEEGNFKDWIVKNKETKEKYFDLVIGNPPFNPSSKGTITEKEFKKIFGKKVPKNRLSLMFLESALYFGKKVCIIIPSNAFLYNKSAPNHQYRREIFTNYSVDKIYDFTHLKETLFTKKKIKGQKQKQKGRISVLALTISNQPSEYQTIEHVVVKRQFQSEQKMRFEIDYYDSHFVPFDRAIDEQKHFVWKTNLLGGGRLFHLIYRLSLLRTLHTYINDNDLKKSKRGFEGGSTITLENKDVITGINNNELVISEDKTITTSNLKDVSIYQPPFIVLNQVIGNNSIPIVLVENYKKKHLYFNRDFIGIKAPKEDLGELQRIYQLIKNDYANLYQAYIFASSSSTMILRDTCTRKEDIDNLPYPENTTYLKTSNTEKVIIDDSLNYCRYLGHAISKRGEGAILHQSIAESDISQFGKTYCDSMNEIYETEQNTWQIGEVKQTPNFTICQIGFGKKGGLRFQYKKEETDSLISNLINNDLQNQGIRFKRIIRYYEHLNGYDCVFFIKPNAKRYWLNSIALRDADDTFMDFKKMDY